MTGLIGTGAVIGTSETTGTGIVETVETETVGTETEIGITGDTTGNEVGMTGIGGMAIEEVERIVGGGERTMI